ncbi:DUF1822 family protein [Leptothoe spongobia]|uniref:DUF1822 family protein n=1 Tax=Leptothoe spongobia TAU-MAC 1115 TaxID=1967444 RepID=A0A947DFS6_9CYAN|nr:DUF1822 family protein [Leptothoe spongobia]MBT9315844.1 DUF1822 family protein [Leptothoe spongobia TAU-MAC 1115]
MSVFFENPVQPVLKIPVVPAQWQRSASISDVAVRWRIYLHQLGLAALMPWFQEEFDWHVLPFPHAAPFDIWHVVDGLALQLGKNRIVIMLSETIDAAELEVPQEWVDLPDWQADYYIAAYIDMDEQRLALWGYTTHSQIKTKGIYSTTQRTYSLNDIDLIQDFSAFWVAQQVEHPSSLSSEPLPHLPAAQVESLMQQLIDTPDPRLALPFAHWGVLISNDHWRQRLYQQRQNPKLVSIEDWLEQIFEHGWQSLDTLTPQTPALKFRSIAGGAAVLTCGKKIFLNTAPDDLLLMFSVDIETDKRRNIRIQLYPSGESLLPSDVVLALELSETGELLKKVQAGTQDNYIQIPPFRCSAGQRLRVHIQLDDSICQEDFIS